MPLISSFGNVLPCERRVGHARALPGSRTRAACFDGAHGQISKIHRFHGILLWESRPLLSYMFMYSCICVYIYDVRSCSENEVCLVMQASQCRHLLPLQNAKSRVPRESYWKPCLEDPRHARACVGQHGGTSISLITLAHLADTGW